MKQSNYPIIFKSCDNEVLKWGDKDIFLVGELNKEYHGDVLALINDCVLEDEVEKVKPYLDIIQAKHDEYLNWYNSFDYKEASKNLQYYKVIDGKYILSDAYIVLKDFMYEKLNISYRSFNDVESLTKNYIEKSITSNTIHSSRIYALNGKPFLMLDSPYDYNNVVDYTILDEDTFILFYTTAAVFSISDNTPFLIEGSNELEKCPPYFENVNFEDGETRYVYVNDEFVPFDENNHDINEPKFKKMIGD